MHLSTLGGPERTARWAKAVRAGRFRLMADGFVVEEKRPPMAPAVDGRAARH